MCKSTFIFLLLLYAMQAQSQTTHITGPAGSGQFGKTVTVLTNGNFVVTDPLYDDGAIADVGAVHLYDGITYSLISTLKGSTANDSVGSGGITALSNGNYLVQSPVWNNGAAADAGAITWCSGITGLSGVVSSSNSLVGSSTGDFSNFAVNILSNGNYLVCISNWDNGAVSNTGAITWGSGTSGVTGEISNSNSLVGSSAGDFSNLTITILNNGNYVVCSPKWDNGTVTDAGAVTWGDGSIGVSGMISSSNSLVGSTANDQVGSGGATVLNNGNYVVRSQLCDNGAIIDAGAVTWGDGTIGVVGMVQSINSLMGSTNNDQVGNSGVAALTIGNYLVQSNLWDNGAIIDAGAVTWGNGTAGVSGFISSSNSLVGSTANDRVGLGGLTVLSNGNYVAISYNWNNGAITQAGAVTWGNGITGVLGVVSSSNSLVGSSANDQVGYNGVAALSNGNYVVNSQNWKNGTVGYAGAVTWGNGTVGKTGAVNSANSLVGSKSYDYVGRGGITVLSNGNYVVRSPYWDSQFFIDGGAVTWGNGNTGVSGVINSSNSLLGNQPNYRAGDIVTALSNSNYVVTIPNWSTLEAHNGGAVTFCNGTTGTTGVVSISNSLVGSTHFDGIGNVLPLSNGNYLVNSPNWDNGGVVDAGAVTFGNGTIGTTGIISNSNSLVNTRSSGISTLSNGNYVVNNSQWTNGSATSVGAVTWGNGLTGITGLISGSNSLIGSTPNDFVGSITALNNGNYLVLSTSWDNGAVTDAGAVTLGNGTNGVTGIITSCNSFTGNTIGEGSSLNFVYNLSFDYLIVGRPLNNIISIFKLPVQTLANSMDSVVININGTTATPLIASAGCCRIIGTLTPTVGIPVNGIVKAKTWIENTVPTHNGYPFVARHYEITPTVTMAGGRITLYFTQQEFNDFNDHSGSTFNLPTGEGDAVGKANFRIGKFPGTSSNGSGLPSTYSGTPELINPIDADIVWNNILNRWEVSFNVFGFSGFIVQTNTSVVPLTLLEFNGRLVNNNGVLNWKTTDEINTLSFDIERSTDGRNYSRIGNVAAINQPGNHLYNYTDNNIISLGVPVVYYRLKLKDMDGRFTYSKIVALPVDNSKIIVRFYPNPVTDEANLMITVTEAGQLQGRITDNTGRIVKQQQWSAPAGSTSLPVDVSRLSNGLYYLELKGKYLDERIQFVKL